MNVRVCFSDVLFHDGLVHQTNLNKKLYFSSWNVLLCTFEMLCTYYDCIQRCTEEASCFYLQWFEPTVDPFLLNSSNESIVIIEGDNSS